MAIQHEDAAHIHKFAYVSGSDPGAVGAYKGWVDTSATPYRFKIRNAGDTAWLDVGVYGADLAAIEALTPTDDDIIQRKSGAWTNRTVSQLKSDLALNLVPNVDARARASHTGTQLAATVSDFNTAVDARIAVATGSFGTIATQDADDVNISGGLIAGIDMDTVNMTGDIFFSNDALKIQNGATAYYVRLRFDDDGLASDADLYFDLDGDASRTILLSGDATLSGTNTGDETITSVGSIINGATSKTTPVDADMVGVMDSEAANVLKKLSWLNLKKVVRNTEFKEVSADTATVDATYSGKLVRATYAGAGVTTLTFPGTSTLGTNFICKIYNATDEDVIIEPDVGVLIVGGNTTLPSEKLCEVIAVGTNEYKIIGESI